MKPSAIAGSVPRACQQRRVALGHVSSGDSQLGAKAALRPELEAVPLRRAEVPPKSSPRDASRSAVRIKPHLPTPGQHRDHPPAPVRGTWGSGDAASRRSTADLARPQASHPPARHHAG